MHGQVIYALAEKQETVYGTFAEDMEPVRAFAVFTDDGVDFTELPEGLTPYRFNELFEFLSSKNIHYAPVSIVNLMATDSEIFKNVNTDTPIYSLSVHSGLPNLDGPTFANQANAGYSWFLNANKNDAMQLYVINVSEDGNIAITKCGNFLWPYEKSISYNPDGALKVSPASGEFNATTGVTLNLEGTGKYGTTMDEIFISDVEQGVESITTLSDCCSILNALDNTSQNIRTVNGFNAIDGTVTISGGFFEGENTLYAYGCTKDASGNWIIKERTSVKFNYTGNLV